MSNILQLSLLPCGYIALTTDGNVVEVNKAFTDMLGLSNPLPAAISFLDLLTISSRILYTTRVSVALRQQRAVQEVALDFLNASGSPVQVLVNATLVQSSTDAVPFIHMAVFGAAERRRHEHDMIEARKRAERAAEVVHRSSDAIVIVSPEGFIEGWNKAAERIFGRDEESARGTSFVDLLFPSESKEDTLEYLAEAATGTMVNFETVALHSQGHEIAVAVRLNPHIEPPGRLTSFSAVIRDITARRLSERALIENEKLASMGRLTSSIAHEINNPLEAVTNLLYILNFQTEDAERRETIRLAQEELARISEIARHTLRFHRHGTDRSQVDVPAMVSSILLLYKAKIQDRRVRVEVQRSSSAPLFCHEGELRQVISNLISNALDALDPGGKLIIRSRDTYVGIDRVQHTRITIADNGSGIATELIAKIFEPFFTTKGIGGSGLGLWITKELIAKNHGIVEIRSSTRTSCSGTVFVLRFPNEPPGSGEPE